MSMKWKTMIEGIERGVVMGAIQHSSDGKSTSWGVSSAGMMAEINGKPLKGTVTGDDHKEIARKKCEEAFYSYLDLFSREERLADED